MNRIYGIYKQNGFYPAILKIGSRLCAGLEEVVVKSFDRPLPEPTDRERELAGRLKQRMSTIQLCQNPVGGVSGVWEGVPQSLTEAAVTADDPREFLRWNELSQMRLSLHYSGYVRSCLRYLRLDRDWQSSWRGLLDEQRVGHPEPYCLYPKSSRNLIHSVYILAKMEQYFGFSPDRLSFCFEFGGGYGNMCRLLHKAGFSRKYVLFDLPPMLELQKYYLENAGIHVTDSGDSFRNSCGNVLICSKMDALKEIIREDCGMHSSLFMATWSLSEAPNRRSIPGFAGQ